MFDTLPFHARVLLRFFKIFTQKNFLFNPVISEFEKKLARFLGLPYVLGVASGTDALILSLKALGIGSGDEVIVPAFSFFSTAGVVPWVNAKPVFVDVEFDSLNLDPRLIECVITPKTKAIIVAHFNGRMADMDPILAIAQKHSLAVIEDAAQAIGAKYKNKPIGHFGDVACLSFNPMKLLGGYGDGGAIVTRRGDIAEKISLMRTYGARFGEFGSRHPIVGVSSRLSAFQAAVLSLKIDHMKGILERARRRYFLYAEFMKAIRGLTTPVNPPPDYLVNGNRSIVFTAQRDALLKHLRKAGINIGRPYAVPLPYLEAFLPLAYIRGDFPVAEKISEEIIVLPDTSSMSENDIQRIAERMKDFFQL